MSVNIYDTINQLESDLRKTEQYEALVKAFEEINKDEKATELMDEFKEIQKLFAEKQQKGESFTEEDQQRALKSSQEMQENEITKKLLAAEYQLNLLIQDVNQAIYKPIRELYE